MYIEASAPRRPGQKARLFSPGNLPTTGACVTFFYHMYGNTMGTLNVYAKVGGALGTPILTTSGNHGNKWLQAQVTVSSASSWSVSNAEILHALLSILMFYQLYVSVIALCMVLMLTCKHYHNHVIKQWFWTTGQNVNEIDYNQYFQNNSCKIYCLIFKCIRITNM